MDEEYGECIEECLSCLVTCNHCFDSCLKHEDPQLNECLRLTRECAEICEYTAVAMSKNSPFIDQYCHLCVDVCMACIKECEKHEHSHCRLCAEACRKCVETCQAFLH